MQDKNLSWTDTQGKKVLQENLRIGHYELRGEPCYDFDLRTSTSIFEELAVIWRFPRQLELSTNNSNFNTPLYVTHSYFLAIRHALANCIAFMKSTKVLVRIGLGSCCALIMQHYGPLFMALSWLNAELNRLS